jgi:hypothetical protein
LLKNATQLLLEDRNMDNKILEQLEEIFSEEVGLVQHDLGQLEELVTEKMRLLGRGLLQRLVDSGSNGYKGSSIVCNCGGQMKFMGHRSKQIHSLFGWIAIKRAYYHCPRCAVSLVPYDQASGLGAEQISPALAKACCLLTVDDSYAQSSRKVEAFTGQKVSANTIEQIAHRVGSMAAAQQDQQLEEFFKHKEIPEFRVQPERLYIAVDGTTAHEIDGWHEAKAATIYWQDQRFERDRRYVARFDKSERFGWHVWLEACKCGYREAKQIIYLGDGAPWIRNQHRRHFGRSTFIIDWYHASEHIWDCGKKLFGEGTKATERWVKKRLDLLWQGWTKKLLDGLKDQVKRHRAGKRAALNDLIRYISTNEQQMRYDVFRAKGYDIGSGAAEGACKNVVGKRLKQSGMIWTRLGSSSVLALRVTWLNDRWEQLWQKKPLAA